MQTILHKCCGMDAHKDSVVACILKTCKASESKQTSADAEKEIRVFGTFPNEPAKLREWPESENCTNVAMESTGIYSNLILRCPKTRRKIGGTNMKRGEV